jgi:hypothetical protein
MNAIAAYGDWQLGELTITYRGEAVLKTQYDYIGELEILYLGIKKIYKLKSSDFYIVGDFIKKNDETRFEENFQIEFKPTNIPNMQETFMNVEGVKVPDKMKGLRIATSLYRYFVKELKFNILGDETQFFGARKLWSSLSKMTDITVDIIDISDGTFLEKDVVIYHGLEDWDFDNRVWSYDVDKKHIRLILKDL